MEGENGQQQLKQAVEEASFCMMAQNASAMLARTGLLFHRQVSDYAYDENWKRMFTVVSTYNKKIATYIKMEYLCIPQGGLLAL